MTLLQKRDEARRERRLSAWLETRAKLRSVLNGLIPGERVVIFGSLTKPGLFHDFSDVDLAMVKKPLGVSWGCLMTELENRLCKRVDLILLSECRFREKIEREGEVWIC